MLRVSAPGDAFEHEADQVASLVLRSPEQPSGQDAGPAGPAAELHVQRSSTADGLNVSPAVETSIAQMHGGGAPLPAGERHFFEQRFGHDFSQIRIHADSHAAETAQSLNARAFTVGSDIAFDAGEYRPGTDSGRQLLAHELTHTIQQTGGIATKRVQRQAGFDDEAESAPTPEATPAQAVPDAGPAVHTGAPATASATAVTPSPAGATPASAPAPASAASPAPAAAALLDVDAQAQAQPAVAAVEPVGAAGEQQASATLDEAKELHQRLAVLAEGKATGPLVQRAPRSPDADPDFQNVKAGITTTATQQKQHAPAEQKANEAAAAAQMPAEERLGQAQNSQAEAIDSAATAQEQAAQGDSAPGFDKAAFVAAVKARIDELTPSDPAKMEDIEGSGVFGDTKQAVDQQVATGKETAQGDVDNKVEETPNTGAVPDKPVTPLATNEPGALPQTNTAAAAPKPQGTDVVETPLLTESQALDQQLTDAQVTPEMLQTSNEPAFQEALTTKTDAQTKVAADLPAYRTQEQSQISTAQTDAQSLGETGVQGMFDSRGQLFGELDGVQGTGKTDDEAKRAEIGREVDRLYQSTKTEVEQILADMDTAVDQCFSSGAERAKQSAIDYIKRETEAYKTERYNRDAEWWRLDQRVAGAVTQAWDTLTDMPPEYYEYYHQGRDLYGIEMEVVLGEVADIVGDHLTRARTRISDGRQQIQDYVDSLPEETRAIAQQTADGAQGKFDALEQQVDAKEQEVVNNLAERYNTAVQEMDAALAEMQEADKGLLARAKDLVGGVLGTIAELKAMLEGVLARAAGVVMQILANPIQFVGNLIGGVGQGLNGFLGNIGTHLETGFVEWLTGTMGGAGIQIPQTLDLPGIFNLATQVLGMTYDNLRQRAVGMFGESVVGALETGFEIFVILATEGLGGAWEWIQEHLAGLQDMVLDGIKEMLITEVLEAGVKWLIGILGGPAGAFIKACMAIYDIVMWFVNNGSRLMALVDAVIDSVVAIASGDLSGAAAAVEDALGRAVPVAIGFLASLLGLGDLSAKVRKIIDRVQEPINRAIDNVLELVRGFVRKIARMLGFGDREGAGGAEGGLGKEVAFEAAEERHRLWVDKQGSTATLMVASTPMSVEQRLAEWEARADSLPEAQRAEAQGLLGRARTLLGSAEQDADFLAHKQEAVKTLADGDLIEQRQNELEGGQDQLAGVLRQLFELFGESSDDADWMQLTKEFISETNHPHTISFNDTSEEPQLVMASSRPKSIEEWIAQRRAAPVALTPDQDASLGQAAQTKIAIDGLTPRAAARGRSKGMPPSNTTGLRDQISVLLDQLAVQLEAGDIDTEQLPLTNVTYRMDAGKPSTVSAEPLTKNPGNTTGSAPGSLPIPGWDHVELIQNEYWVRLHLLSEELHGPGDFWNLVPARNALNLKVYRDVEQQTITDVNANEVLFYDVAVQYHSGPIIHNFPSQIAFTFGKMVMERGEYVRRQSTTRTFDAELPPTTTIVQPDVYSLSTSSRNDLAQVLEYVIARDVVSVRGKQPGDVFRDDAHFMEAMEEEYGSTFTGRYWPVIQALIVAGQLVITGAAQGTVVVAPPATASLSKSPVRKLSELLGNRRLAANISSVREEKGGAFTDEKDFYDSMVAFYQQQSQNTDFDPRYWPAIKALIDAGELDVT